MADKKIQCVEFRNRLRQWKTISIQDISVDPTNVLYIIGNGFDNLKREVIKDAITVFG